MYLYDPNPWYKDGFIVTLVTVVSLFIVGVVLCCVAADYEDWTDNGNGCYTLSHSNNHLNWTTNETTRTVYCKEK